MGGGFVCGEGEGGGAILEEGCGRVFFKDAGGVFEGEDEGVVLLFGDGNGVLSDSVLGDGFTVCLLFPSPPPNAASAAAKASSASFVTSSISMSFFFSCKLTKGSALRKEEATGFAAGKDNLGLLRAGKTKDSTDVPSKHKDPATAAVTLMVSFVYAYDRTIVIESVTLGR